MKKKVTSILMTAIMLGTMGNAFGAEQLEISPEQQEINLLKERLMILEQKVVQQEKEKEKEKKAIKDSKKKDFQFAGDGRLRYRDEGAGSIFDQRVRITMKKPLDDHSYFFSRWVVMNNNKFGSTGDKDNKVNVFNASVHYKDFLAVDGLEIAAGRIGQDFGATQYLLAESTGRMDGVKFTQILGKGKYTLGYADFSPHSSKSEMIVADMTAKVGKVTTNQTATVGESIFAAIEYSPIKDAALYGAYINEKSSDQPKDFDYRAIGGKVKVAQNVNFLADYGRNYAKEGNPSGLYTSLRYRAADYNKPKSYEVRFDYRDIKKDSMYGTGLGNVSLPQQGYKGPGLSFLYVPVKDMRFAVHQTFRTKDADTGEDKDDFTRLDFTWKM